MAEAGIFREGHKDPVYVGQLEGGNIWRTRIYMYVPEETYSLLAATSHPEGFRRPDGMVELRWRR